MKPQFFNVRPVARYLALLMVPALSLCALAKDTSQSRGQLSASDYKFARKAACGGMAEASLGKLAAERAANPQVQQFGQQMVTDHGKANDELKQIAASKGALLPDQPTKAQQKDLDRLSKVSGAEFDRDYIKLMVRDHQQDVKEFKEAAEDAKDPELKAFAGKTLSVIQHHLKMAEELESAAKHGVSANRQNSNRNPLAKD